MPLSKAHRRPVFLLQCSYSHKPAGPDRIKVLDEAKLMPSQQGEGKKGDGMGDASQHEWVTGQNPYEKGTLFSVPAPMARQAKVRSTERPARKETKADAMPIFRVLVLLALWL